jgi:hypothetical protein
MVKVLLPYEMGEGCLKRGRGRFNGHIIFNRADSVTTPSIGFKYVIVP